MNAFLWGFVTGAFAAMMFSNRMRRAPQLQNVHRGFEVFTSDDQRIGHVDEVHRNQIVLWQAGPGGEDYCIPAHLVSGVEMRRVRLGVTRGDLDRQVQARTRLAA